jgi:hypothetical protein
VSEQIGDKIETAQQTFEPFNDGLSSPENRALWGDTDDQSQRKRYWQLVIFRMQNNLFIKSDPVSHKDIQPGSSSVGLSSFASKESSHHKAVKFTV